MLEKNWWKKAVVYEIYPRSFYDSNGDGIGDIQGIIEKLDYLEELGVNVLWLCPVYKSPMSDNGYDVADYYQIDPSYGTVADMERLIGEAKKRGIAIIMDMVVNHCSDEHEWFRKAIRDPEGEYGKYFYIRKGENGNPPNNWRSIFGGSAWEPIPGTSYYYLHIFTKKQPDLNWENERLREEIYTMMNWWLDKGIAGFRLDAITYLKKAPGLPSYEPDGSDGLVSACHGSLNHEGIDVFLTELRERTYGRRNAMTVGETAGVPEEELLRFISTEHGYFSMIFEFAEWEIALKGPNYFWYEPLEWTPNDVRDQIFRSHEKAGTEGWYGVYLENHDQPRSIDHYLPEEGQNYYGASMLAAMFLLRRGTPFVYQGEELGMRNVRWDSISCYDDCSSVNHYERALKEGLGEERAMECVHRFSRDNARTPFQWSEKENGGFGSGKPWLSVNENYREINAEKVRSSEPSLFSWYQALISLRLRSEYGEILTEGSFEPIFAQEDCLMAYRRTLAGRSVAVLCNYRGESRRIPVDMEKAKVLLDNYGTPKTESGELLLRPFEALVMEASV